MGWIILIVAGLFDVGWAIGLKYTDGFTRLWSTLWTVLAMLVSLWSLGMAMKSLPVGAAYSGWGWGGWHGDSRYRAPWGAGKRGAGH